MGAMIDMQQSGSKQNMSEPLVGLGLRHVHYKDALTSVAPIDFVELHSENFFADGGAIAALLNEISEKYRVSLHSTALGLGSADIPDNPNLLKLFHLVQRVNPILISDHASFSWGVMGNTPIHAGDLLPLSFNAQSLEILARNVDTVQQTLGRQMLVENLSSYIWFDTDTMSETEFLSRLTELTGCGLLLDLNNILVSGHNTGVEDVDTYAQNWINDLPTGSVGEIHLAGFTPVNHGELAVDDHSQKVSDDCWKLYELALERFGAIPTLIEWDNNLPKWSVLLKEVAKARQVAKQLCISTQERESWAL